MSFYETLGVRRVVNAATTLTRLGGSTMPPQVVAAMTEAATTHVDMSELQRRAGEELATLTGNEAAWVSSGAAAGLVLCIIASRTRGDERLISRLPKHASLASRVVMYTAHRNPYDRVVALAGCSIQTVGNVKQTFEYELEAALEEKPAAILFVAGRHMPNGGLPLSRTVEIARDYGVPVIVDAAAQLPPKSNLYNYTREQGADFAVFSGGKQLLGPQASGLIVGSARSMAWIPPNAPPLQRYARAFKVGKEEIAGLVTAVRMFVEADEDARRSRAREQCDRWQRELQNAANARAEVESHNAGGASLPRLKISLLGATEANDLADALWNLDPRVAVMTGDHNCVYIEPDLLAPGEEKIVMDAILGFLSR